MAMHLGVEVRHRVGDQHNIVSLVETLTPDRFHDVFLLSAVIPLLGIPGFLTLARNDGARAVSSKKTFPETEEQDREAAA